MYIAGTLRIIFRSPAPPLPLRDPLIPMETLTKKCGFIKISVAYVTCALLWVYSGAFYAGMLSCERSTIIPFNETRLKDDLHRSYTQHTFSRLNCKMIHTTSMRMQQQPKLPESSGRW